MVNEAKRFFRFMDQDQSGQVTFFEYWHFIKRYLQFKGITKETIYTGRDYYKQQFSIISENKWSFTEA